MLSEEIPDCCTLAGGAHKKDGTPRSKVCLNGREHTRKITLDILRPLGAMEPLEVGHPFVMNVLTVSDAAVDYAAILDDVSRECRGYTTGCAAPKRCRVIVDRTVAFIGFVVP